MQYYEENSTHGDIRSERAGIDCCSCIDSRCWWINGCLLEALAISQMRTLKGCVCSGYSSRAVVCIAFRRSSSESKRGAFKQSENGKEFHRELLNESDIPSSQN